MRLRRLEAADVDAAQAVVEAAFAPRRPHAGRWPHLLGTDPDGLWAAVDAGRVVGVAAALRRGPVWGLSMLAVSPDVQQRGVGRALLDAALGTAEGAESALIVSSTDPRAIRRYARAGFALRPTLSASGDVDHARLPTLSATRVGTEADLDLTAAVDRRVRGAARAADLAAVLAIGCSLVVADRPGRGYALVCEGSVFTLAAEDVTTAQRVLARALATTSAETDTTASVRSMDAAQGWAVPVVLDAGLALTPSGPLCVRGHPAPLTPYLPSGAYL